MTPHNCTSQRTNNFVVYCCLVIDVIFVVVYYCHNWCCLCYCLLLSYNKQCTCLVTVSESPVLLYFPLNTLWWANYQMKILNQSLIRSYHQLHAQWPQNVDMVLPWWSFNLHTLSLCTPACMDKKPHLFLIGAWLAEHTRKGPCTLNMQNLLISTQEWPKTVLWRGLK